MKLTNILLLMLLPLGAMAQKNDTIVICNANKVDIYSSKDGNQVSVNVYGRGTDENFRYTYNALQTPADTTDFDVDFIKNKDKKIFRSKDNLYKRKTKEWFYFNGVHIGYLMPENKDAFRHGWEFGFSNLVGFNYAPWKKGPQLRTGLGFASRNYRGQYGMLFSNDRKHLTVSPATPAMSDNKCNLSTFAMQLPFEIYQPLNQHIAVGIGAILDWNVGVLAKNSYKIGETKYEESFGGLNYNPFGVDLKAFVSLWGMELYVKHSPTQIFSKGDGPQLKRTAIGVAINF